MLKWFLTALAALGLLMFLGGGLSVIDQPDNGSQLEQPAFLGVEAQAQETGSNFLKEQAGIAAYLKLTQSIDIEPLREDFKVVEQLEDQYLTGQIAVPDLKENWHPRIFVSQDGWIVAYYPKDVPTSRILARWIQTNEKTLTKTTLELAIREVLKNIGSGMVTRVQGIKYYHFQFPDANRIMLIREGTNYDINEEDTFQLTIPSGLHVVDATWAAKKEPNDSEIGIDGELITEFGPEIEFDDLLPGLTPGSRQTLRVKNADLGIILLYQKP